MNLKSAKKASEVKLAGVTAEIENRNGNPYTLTLNDGKGGVVRVTASYGIDILVQAPPKTVQKFRLAGNFAGLVPVSEDFASEFDAQQRLHEYERKHNGDSAEVGLTINSVEVPEEE